MGLVSRLTGKKYKYKCYVTKPTESAKHDCGSKWGPKVEVKHNDDHDTHIHKQCPGCEKRDEKLIELLDYEYKCPQCGRTHGKQYESRDNADTTWEKCSDCESNTATNTRPSPHPSHSQFRL